MSVKTTVVPVFTIKIFCPNSKDIFAYEITSVIFEERFEETDFDDLIFFYTDHSLFKAMLALDYLSDTIKMSLKEQLQEAVDSGISNDPDWRIAEVVRWDVEVVEETKIIGVRWTNRKNV